MWQYCQLLDHCRFHQLRKATILVPRSGLIPNRIHGYPFWAHLAPSKAARVLKFHRSRGLPRKARVLPDRRVTSKLFAKGHYCPGWGQLRVQLPLRAQFQKPRGRTTPTETYRNQLRAHYEPSKAAQVLNFGRSRGHSRIARFLPVQRVNWEIPLFLPQSTWQQSGPRAHSSLAECNSPTGCPTARLSQHSVRA